MAVSHCQRVHLKHITAKVARLRMVGRMQADRFAVVVDGNVNVAANGQLDASGCATATGEQVNHQLCVHRQEKLRGKHLGLQKSKSPHQAGWCE